MPVKSAMLLDTAHFPSYRMVHINIVSRWRHYEMLESVIPRLALPMQGLVLAIIEQKIVMAEFINFYMFCVNLCIYCERALPPFVESHSLSSTLPTQLAK